MRSVARESTLQLQRREEENRSIEEDKEEELSTVEKALAVVQTQADEWRHGTPGRGPHKKRS